MAKVELRADRKTGGLSSFLTEGAFRGLFTERQGRAFLRGSYPGTCIPPALTQTELSARLVSARIPHIRGEVVTANFLELRYGEVQHSPGPADEETGPRRKAGRAVRR